MTQKDLYGDLPDIEEFEESTKASLNLIKVLRETILALPNKPELVHGFQLCLRDADQRANTLRQKLPAIRVIVEARLPLGSIIDCGWRCSSTWHELPLIFFETLHEYCSFSKAFRGAFLWPKDSKNEQLQYILSACISKYRSYDYEKLCEANAFFNIDQDPAPYSRIKTEILKENFETIKYLRELKSKEEGGA